MPIIEKMIVHNLNLGGDTPIHSDDLINLPDLELENGALDFFREHIRNNRLHSNTKRCNFKPTTANHLKTSIIEMNGAYNEQNFDDLFIEKSIIIADHLANSMRGKSSSDGSVFILLYTYEDQRYLGILKMDPNLGIQVTEDLTLIVRPHMLPSTKVKLHKSAFILFQNEFNEGQTHLYALDRQQTKDEAAKYFMNDFLQAQERANDSNMTTTIEREIKNEICAQIQSPQLRSEFSSKLKTKLISGEVFNLDEDLPPLAREFFPVGFALAESIDSIKVRVFTKYPDATFEFTPNPLKVKGIEFKSEDQSVTIKINVDVDEDLYSYDTDEETGETVFRFSPVLNVIPKN